MPEVRWRERLPDAVIETPDGERVDLGVVKQKRNIVLLLLSGGRAPDHALFESLMRLQPEMAERGAEFLAGTDPEDALGRVRECPVLLVADRFGMVFAQVQGGEAIRQAAEDGEILSWLNFIEMQCDECGNPEW